MSRYHSAVTYSFSKDLKEGNKPGDKQKLPGPGKYKWDKIPKKNAPKITMSQSKRPPLHKFNGPDVAYPLQTFMGKEGPKYTMSSKAGKNTTVEKELSKVPEPGRYHPKIYSQYSKLDRNISMHKKFQYKEHPDTPGPGDYDDKTGMLTKYEDEENLVMSKTTMKYIQNYGKVNHHTTKELFRPSTAPKYGFSQVEYGTQHGLTAEQVQNYKTKNIQRKGAEELRRQEQLQKMKEDKKKRGEIPKQKRKPDNKTYIQLEQPKFGFGRYKKGQDKIEVRQKPNIIVDVRK